MQYPKHAIVSCAGLGTRLGLDIPKCLLEIHGRTIIDRQLELLKNIEDVRVVVGFKEQLVIEHVRTVRPDVVFVRNPDYARTSNTYSLWLGSRFIKKPYVILDGDLIVNPRHFSAFLRQAASSKRSIVGITRIKTEDAVFVQLNAQKQVVAFERHSSSFAEWCGIAYLAGITIEAKGDFVYRQISPYLPLPAFEFDCYEVDTPQDLDLANLKAQTICL